MLSAVPNFNGNLYAINATSGTQIWNASVGDGVSPPVIADEVVYVGSAKWIVTNSSEYDQGQFFAFDANTGVKLWTITETGPSRFGTPAVANGILYDSQGGNLRVLMQVMVRHYGTQATLYIMGR